ncbi:MAG: hypothetical protein HKN12_09810, partial [Gemmatimonadetes bacterium]|nr:hypothetical protein [Gemmatimonadota bacterium]
MIGLALVPEPTLAAERTGPSGIRFGSVRAWGDAERFHLRFGTGMEIGLQSDNAVVLAIDADDSAETGMAVRGTGAYFQWRFGERRGTAHPYGLAVPVSHASVGLRQAPTTTGTEFQIS